MQHGHSGRCPCNGQAEAERSGDDAADGLSSGTDEPEMHTTLRAIGAT